MGSPDPTGNPQHVHSLPRTSSCFPASGGAPGASNLQPTNHGPQKQLNPKSPLPRQHPQRKRAGEVRPSAAPARRPAPGPHRTHRTAPTWPWPQAHGSGARPCAYKFRGPCSPRLREPRLGSALGIPGEAAPRAPPAVRPRPRELERRRSHGETETRSGQEGAARGGRPVTRAHQDAGAAPGLAPTPPREARTAPRGPPPFSTDAARVPPAVVGSRTRVLRNSPWPISPSREMPATRGPRTRDLDLPPASGTWSTHCRTQPGWGAPREPRVRLNWCLLQLRAGASCPEAPGRPHTGPNLTIPSCYLHP